MMTLLLVSVAMAEPSVRLLDAGSEPRAPLRLEVSPGQTDVVDIRMGTSMDVGMGAAMTLPTMRLGLKFDTGELTANGMKYTFEIVDAGVEGGDPAIAEPLRESLQPMVGFAGEATVDARGHTTGLVMKPPPGLPKELSSNLDRSLTMVGAPLPAEPVGVGARWTLEQDVSQQMLTVHQSTTWTLVSREGSVVVLDAVIVQTAEPQAIQDPNMPPGASIQLTSFRSEGSGRTELDLTSLVPTSSSMKMDLKMAMESKLEGLALPMQMDMGIEMNLAKRAAAGR